MRTIRIAIVGAGVWGDTHAAIYREHPLAEPVAICDRDVDRARALADKYGIPSVYGSVEEMLEAGGFDAVSIVTPDHLHADIAVACAAAGKPWVLDPVGIGIGSLRTKLLSQMKEFKPTIIRGNASEAIALAELWGLEAGTAAEVRGVDSTQGVDEAHAAAVALARFTGGAVAVSGEVDLVTDGEVVCHSRGGSHFMAKITGSGCSLGGVCAVFAATAETPLAAALAGVQAYNLAGARAEARVDAPASFQTAFLDELYKATPHDIANNPFDIEEA